LARAIAPSSRIIRSVKETPPITLTDVREIAPAARRVVAAFKHDFNEQLAGAEVHHIGATALPFGHTKGDVDVNVRVEESRFSEMVAALSERVAIAQPGNWSECFASFSTDAYGLPLGVQVTTKGSKDDFLLGLRDRMLADDALLR
jgi:GrpB-like predicted nucleotidyltransferase (UPF0157 family)